MSSRIPLPRNERGLCRLEMLHSQEGVPTYDSRWLYPSLKMSAGGALGAQLMLARWIPWHGRRMDWEPDTEAVKAYLARRNGCLEGCSSCRAECIGTRGHYDSLYDEPIHLCMACMQRWGVQGS